jgi:hypothetical protein
MKIFNLLALCLLISITSLGQETIRLNKVTLHSGEVFVGEILLNNQEIILIKTQSGSRFQFPVSEIKSIEQNDVKTSEIKKENDIELIDAANLCGIFEINGGISNAENKYRNAISNQLSLSFGTRKVAKKEIFVGGGVGYFNVFLKNGVETNGFIPVFLRLKTNLTDKKTSPYLGLDAGYAFALSSKQEGGQYSKFSFGINRKINFKTSLFLGLYANVLSFNANLVETNNFGVFNYYGKTSMINFGVNLGLQF